MTDEQKRWLAKSYANAWNAIKTSKVRVTVEPDGSFTIHYLSGFGYPIKASRVHADRLFKGLAALTISILNKDFELEPTHE